MPTETTPVLALDSARCPCLSGQTFGECCAPFHRGDAVAPTAERLMRSRYSAFAVGDRDYLLKTWHPYTRPRALDLDPDQHWYRLLGRTDGGLLDRTGTVEFCAHYRLNGDAGRQRENSRFLREGARWLYLDAV
jgi:SEC-C motif-containing protein